MTSQYATFGLAPAMRAGGVLSKGAYQIHRDFLDFIVDGRPLLSRLADLDAVSPLAADLGPTIFTAQVRGLLLETEAPLPAGRRVLYGCPECVGLECGVVTAVIERDGPDVVWRDFAWQTDDTPDIYPDLGPYRFHGGQYRAELERLLALEAPAGRRVLLVGQRAAFLAKLAAALRTIGIGAEISRDAAAAHADELRGYGVVAFGRTVGPEERAAVRDAFAAAGSDAVFVAESTPIVPLLVARIEQALDRSPQEQRRLAGLRAEGGEAVLEVVARCGVRLVAHRLDRLGRPRTHDLFDGRLEPGIHRIPLDARVVRGDAFVVARTSSTVLVAPVGC
ncbi:oxidoreductase [Streptomyces milbemycinicus]|uniref:oxidoreductase n=1 Tax=Streptomyces milbemycinicus TaxID=476552 RepID=UPI000A398BB9|nr:oxidoreductase [Streptomyces milbemycinicus]